MLLRRMGGGGNSAMCVLSYQGLRKTQKTNTDRTKLREIRWMMAGERSSRPGFINRAQIDRRRTSNTSRVGRAVRAQWIWPGIFGGTLGRLPPSYVGGEPRFQNPQEKNWRRRKTAGLKGREARATEGNPNEKWEIPPLRHIERNRIGFPESRALEG